eukprot:UN12146
MHGFFIHNRLYQHVKTISTTDTYEQMISNRTQKAKKRKRDDRISVIRKLPKFNKDYALALLKRDGKQKKKDANAGGILQDSRFSALFEDEDFAIDKDSTDYMRVTGGGQSKMLDTEGMMEKFDLMDASEDR